MLVDERWTFIYKGEERERDGRRWNDGNQGKGERPGKGWRGLHKGSTERGGLKGGEGGEVSGGVEGSVSQESFLVIPFILKVSKGQGVVLGACPQEGRTLWFLAGRECGYDLAAERRTSSSESSTSNWANLIWLLCLGSV